ncbi:hypothetical protein [Georgenia subflava]|uniref:Uncharacterized protein n=1 Tax=Georgenia subflava TaxID=1622177 RepID=A0A6N7EL93_9MICO|nr:hypothetical protein [Georgenia subflava]MPV37325.1 hypothetical protein [Georgenia subflava]
MIPVGSADIPADGDELAHRVAHALTESLHLQPENVAVSAELPSQERVTRLAVDLSGGVIDNRYLSGSAISLRPPASTTGGVPATLESGTLTGRPLVVFGAPVELQLDVEHVPAAWLHDDGDRLWLAFRDERSTSGATAGRAVVEGDVAALSEAVGTAAAAVGRQKGVSVKDVQVRPRTVGPNRWSVDIAARVTKGFASSNVTARAEVRLDEALVLHVDELTAQAGGIIGALAGGIIESVLGRYRNRSFPLTEQTFAGARLTSLDVELGERFTITATLGS